MAGGLSRSMVYRQFLSRTAVYTSPTHTPFSFHFRTQLEEGEKRTIFSLFACTFGTCFGQRVAVLLLYVIEAETIKILPSVPS